MRADTAAPGIIRGTQDQALSLIHGLPHPVNPNADLSYRPRVGDEVAFHADEVYRVVNGNEWTRPVSYRGIIETVNHRTRIARGLFKVGPGAYESLVVGFAEVVLIERGLPA